MVKRFHFSLVLLSFCGSAFSALREFSFWHALREDSACGQSAKQQMEIT
jgi:hypothetical protein